MVDPNVTPPDDFASGLEVPEPVATNAADPVSSWMQAAFEGLPADVTPDKFADDVMVWREKALQAEELERQNKEYQQQLMAMAQQAATTPSPAATPSPPATETPAERKRRYEAIRIDQEVQQFLTEAEPDANGYYKPKQGVYSPQVIAACNRANEAIARRREISSGIVDDFYASWDEGAQHSQYIAALEKRMKDMEAQWESRWNEQVAPLQKSASDLETERFLYEHQSLLYSPDPANPSSLIPNAAGQMFGMLLDKKMSKEDALEIVKASAAMVQPPSAPAPAPAATPPAPQSKRDNRFAAPILRRANGAAPSPTERRPSQAIPTSSFRPTWSEITNAALAAGDN